NGAAVSLSSTATAMFQASAIPTPLNGTITLNLTGNSVASASGAVYVTLSQNVPSVVQPLASTTQPNQILACDQAAAQSYINGIYPSGILYWHILAKDFGTAGLTNQTLNGATVWTRSSVAGGNVVALWAGSTANASNANVWGANILALSVPSITTPYMV